LSAALNSQIVTLNVIITRRHFLLSATKHREFVVMVGCSYQLERFAYVM